MSQRPHHSYGGVEHRQPGPFDECLLCQIQDLKAEIAALKAINSWALERVPSDPDRAQDTTGAAPGETEQTP